MSTGFAIPLSNGSFALVSACDYEKVRGYTWWVERRGDMRYARATVSGKQVYMHRLITGAARTIRVDHRNMNGLDNRRDNIRVCSQSENMQNTTKRRGNYTSRFKGVCKIRKGNKEVYRANIKHNYKNIQLGNFANEEDAARAYDEAALKLFGEFARTNFPSGKKVAA